MVSVRPIQSDGPDPVRGGYHCRQHHDGVREGIVDSCCCCNPCLYNRPIRLENPCRCVPKFICFLFRGDAGQEQCCAELTTTAIAKETPQGMTYYTASFGTGVDFRLSIQSMLAKDVGASDFPAFWRLQSTGLLIDETYRIDHVHTTCLTPPAISISGVTINTPAGPCVGTITLEPYRAAKVKFRKLAHVPSEDILIPYPQCGCNYAVDKLCVWGRRKVGGSFEGVVFEWDRVNGDRWSYTPPCALPSDLAQEHIYLRGDIYGACYLELDFSQSGSTTNDWADPPNTFDGTDPYLIRPGMLPISSCACGLSVRAVSSGGRSIAITAGQCQKYDYGYCGTCRCVPESLCVIGMIDGQVVQGKMTWDGDEWVSAGGPYLAPWSLSLTTGDCAGAPSGRSDPSKCAIQANGTFVVPFLKGDITECGPFLSFAINSAFDPAFPNSYNFLYGHASQCGCKTIDCGPCKDERCGGPPDVLYADLEAVITRHETVAGMLTGNVTTENCNLQVQIFYYQRWQDRRLICGYIGTAVLPGGGTFTLHWDFSLGRFDLTRRTSAGVITTTETFAFDYYVTCTPFLWISDWITGFLMPPRYCAWGPEYESPAVVVSVDYRVILSE